MDERAALIQAARFDMVDYLYFRRFTDGRSSQVAAYVVDNLQNRLTEVELANLHHALWMGCTAPLLYVAWPTRIDIASCARGPDFWNSQTDDVSYSPAASIQLAANVDHELQQRFSARRLADGTLWDDPKNSDLVKYETAAHQTLINAIVDADEALGGARQPQLRRLLLLTVLIKYLEDRRVFPNEGWFGRFHRGARSFEEVLRSGKPDAVRDLLEFLEQKFNGDIFGPPRGERWELTTKVLGEFADLVEAQTIKRQKYLWKQYSFNHLPVEVVSHLYQRFVKDGHGTVYTPPVLAAMLLDRAMPYETLQSTARVLDPSCGSGIFLVGAFRRLVNAWRAAHQWRTPDVATLKAILAKGIFGVEMERGAIDLAVFSLALALSDALQPDVIWTQLKFDKLRDRNLLHGEFFATRYDADHVFDEGFDYVIGNPPFESKLPASVSAHNKDVPDRQAAYLFLKKSTALLRSGGRLCLLQPAGFLYNPGAERFRQSYIRKNNVVAIYDFVSIRQLFDGADTKAVAVSVVHGHTDPTIQHITFRRTAAIKERIAFEVDHYDWHEVARDDALHDPYVWRVNLFGGGRLHALSRRIRAVRTLREYLTSAAARGWDYGEGFIAGKSGKRKKAPFLTNKPLLPTEALTAKGIDTNKLSTVKETLFRSAYTPKRFTGPVLMIKKSIGLPMALQESGFLAYRDRIVGVHAPKRDLPALLAMSRRFQTRSDLYSFSLLLHSSESVVSKATTVRKQDIDALPFPDDDSELDLESWERDILNDVVERFDSFVRVGQNSNLLLDAADRKTMKKYSAVFCSMLGSVYDDLKSHATVALPGLLCQTFYFGDAPGPDWAKVSSVGESLNRLVYSDHHAALRTVRVVRVYQDNVVCIIKPDRLRYWIPSVAIRDADETLIDLQRQGF